MWLDVPVTHPGASAGPGQANVQAGTEGAGAIGVVLDAEEGSVDVLDALVHSVDLVLLENPPDEQKPVAVGRGKVGQADLHSVPRQGRTS